VADIYSLSIRADTRDIRRGRQDLDRFGNQAGRTRTGVDRLGRSFGGLTSASGLLRNAIAGLVAGLGAREIIQYSDSWRSVENQLKQVTDSTEELRARQSELMDVANDTRASFTATGNLYARLARSTTELGLSTSDLIDLTTTINQSFAASGATATEAAAAITQLSQGLAAGALRGDEFNSVAEQAPAIMRAIADSLDMTIGELRAFAKEGGITADILITALSGAADKIASDFESMTATFGQSMTVARNNLTEFIGQNETLSTAVDSAGEAVLAFSENLDDVADVAAALAIIIGGKFAGSVAASAAAMAAAQVQAVRYQAVLASMAGVSRGAAASQIALASATRIASGAMALLGGPVGVALIAAGSLYYFRDALFETSIELTETEKNVKALSDRMGDLTEAELRHERTGIERKIRATTVALANARQEAERLAKAQSDSAAKSASGIGSISTLADMGQANTRVAQLDSQSKALNSTLGEVNASLEGLALGSAATATEELAKETKAAAEAAKKMADNYASVISALNPAQAEFTRYADQLDMIDSFNISMREKEALREESFRQHQERMNAIASEGNAGMIATASDGQRQKLLEDEQENTLSSSASFFGNLAAIAQKGGKDQFEAYKVLASAQAAISATMAIVSTLGDPTVPAPLKVPLAFSIGALAAVQVAQIQSQTYSGARAMGGSVTGGNSYMVGENGPEVVTMGGSGVVTPSSVNNNGGTTNVTQVFQLGGGGGDAKRQILAAAPFIKAQAKQAVLEAINQGGAMSRAVGRRG